MFKGLKRDPDVRQEDGLKISMALGIARHCLGPLFNLQLTAAIKASISGPATLGGYA